MSGFGDPLLGLGFGDPTPSQAYNDLGFGDPSELDYYYIDLETRDVYHSGGAEVIFRGIFLNALAPYRAEITVNNTPLFFHSGEAGESSELTPLRNTLTAYTPPAPVGVYPVVLRFGLNYTQSVTLSITYRADNRGAPRYRLRELFPAHYRTGPRASSLERLDQGVSVEPETNLEMITDTIGRMFQEISGSSQTITRSNTLRGALVVEVESVLGFAPSGELWLNKELHKYDQVSFTNNTITLNQALRYFVSSGERVVYHAP